MRIDLADTLLAVLGGLPDGDDPVTVQELDLTLPLEVTAAATGEGLRFYAHPPHTRWRSGLLPGVHLVRLRVVAGRAGGADGEVAR